MGVVCSYLSNTTLHCNSLYQPTAHSLLNLDLSIEPLPYGYPEDLSVALGTDMFDCVWATRTDCFGNAITSLTFGNRRSQSPFTLRTSHAPAPSAFLRHSTSHAYIHNVYWLLQMMHETGGAIVKSFRDI